jgi:hypothetical protein
MQQDELQTQLQTLLAMVAIDNDTPRTYNEALAQPDAHEWLKAMREEGEGLEAIQAWKLVPLPPERKALPGKWVYKLKQDVNGVPIRYKARWCAREDRQKQGIDYRETYAAIARSTSFRACMAICAQNGLHYHQMDVITAFLNGELEPDTVVYMIQPYSFEKGNPSTIYLLIKALYGLKQQLML